MKYIRKFKLYEAKYNYHVGDLNKPKLEPYYSDNIFVMSGRGTGHFGSGMYFSTYTLEDKADYDTKHSNSFRSSPNLIQVDNRVYRVDMDIYKNLFRVTSSKQAEFLFKTLKLVNHVFYYYLHYDLIDISTKYLIIKNNLEALHLKVPIYRKFIDMLNVACDDYKRGKDGNIEVNNASMSTRIMEFNGFNGINVSGIVGYDNTTHGSVIYDVNKLSDIPIEVENMTPFMDIKNDVIGEYDNPKSNLLRNSTLFFDKINKLSIKQQIIYIKRFKKYLHSFELDKLAPEVSKSYIKSLPFKIKNDLMIGEPDIRDIELLIDNKYMNLILDKDIKIGNVTFLSFVLGMLWKFPNRYQKIIFNSINRELDEKEKYYYDDFKDNWLEHLN